MIMADSQASKSRAVLCPCGAGICPLLTSNTQKNPGRQFYRCPANQCRFFKWLDQVESHQFLDIPVCACGAGICRIQTKASGPNAGRKFFVCPIKRGQGACNYFLWQDDAQANVAMSYSEDEISSFSPSILTICSGISPSNNNQVEEGEPTNLEHEMESFTAETSQFSKNLVSTSSLLKRDEILEELKGSEDTSDQPSRKHRKRARHGDSESNGIPFGSSSECWAMPLPNLKHSLSEEPPQDSFEKPKMEINEKMNEFRSWSFGQETDLAATCSFPSSYSYSSTLPMNSEVLLESCLMVTTIHQGIHVQLHGWLGRLAFRPPRSLMEPAPKPFFCCVFPSFDPIFVSKRVNLCDDHGPASSLGSSFGAESNSKPLSTMNKCPQLLRPQKSGIMTELVSKAFAKAAEQLQNDLVTLLKSMDIQDHETLSREADATFAALDQLQIDHKQFSGQVKELICHASLLAKIDQSISDDHSCQLLLDRFNSEKTKLLEINDAFAKGVDAFFTSKQQLMLLSGEVSHLKDKLSQIEAELSCCITENLALKARIVQIGEDRGKVWQTFRIASKELENAYKLRESREAERSAAKAAFEEAKVVLWG